MDDERRCTWEGIRASDAVFMPVSSVFFDIVRAAGSCHHDGDLPALSVFGSIEPVTWRRIGKQKGAGVFTCPGPKESPNVTDCTVMRVPIVRIYLPQSRAFMSPCCRLVLRWRGMTPGTAQSKGIVHWPSRPHNGANRQAFQSLDQPDHRRRIPVTVVEQVWPDSVVQRDGSPVLLENFSTLW